MLLELADSDLTVFKKLGNSFVLMQRFIIILKIITINNDAVVRSETTNGMHDLNHLVSAAAVVFLHLMVG